MGSQIGLDSKGFSLVQVMVSAAIMGVIATGFASLIKNTFDAQRAVSTRQDITSLTLEIQSIFSNSEICRNSLVPGIVFNPTQASTRYPSPSGEVFLFQGLPFQMRINNEILREGAQLRSFDLNIDRFQLVNGSYAGTTETGDPVYKMQLIGQFSPRSSVGGGLKEFSIKTLASGYISVNSGTIATCTAESSADEDQMAETCRNLGGIYNSRARRCDIPPNFRDPVIVSQMCSALGGVITNGQCTMPSSGTGVVVVGGGGGAGSGSSGTRWHAEEIMCSGFSSSIPSCGDSPSAGQPCPTSGYRCRQFLGAGTGNGCGLQGGYQHWLCN